MTKVQQLAHNTLQPMPDTKTSSTSAWETKGRILQATSDSGIQHDALCYRQSSATEVVKGC